MMATITERLLETARSLPEPLLTEVLDFAEFFRARHASLEAETADPRSARLVRRAGEFDDVQ